MRAVPHAFFLALFLLLPCGAAAAAPAPASSDAAAPPASDAARDETRDKAIWGEMPAGARSVYIGIHGGTVPVSLLTAGDGSPMIARVGLTGTDFLSFMRRGAPPDLAEAAAAAEMATDDNPAGPAAPAGSEAGGSPDARDASPSPSPAGTAAIAGEGDARAERGELPESVPVLLLPGNNATLLLAGQSGGDVPVIYATGRAFERMSLVPANWAPFGLTEKPLSLEGEVKILTQPKKLPRHKRRAYRR